MKIRFSYVAISLAALGITLAAQNNTTGQIVGTVADSSGAVITTATLKLTSDAGIQRMTQTSADGSYAFSLLPPGTYHLEASASNFKTMALPDIQVGITESTHVDVELPVGSAEEKITVTADAAIVESENAAQGRILNNRVVAELPLATRNFTQILSLSTGTATYLPDNTSVGRNSQNISVNGARVTNNNYMINGVDANSQGTNSAPSLAVPAPESIEQFKVQTSLYDAAFGRSGGGSIQAVTKSGTNDLHGQVYEYFRNAALNSNNPFLKAAGVARPQLSRNVFGGTIGGAIKKDKTFFFGSYQGTRETNGASLVNSLSVNVKIAAGLTNDRSEQTLLNTFRPSSPVTGPATGINSVALQLLNAKLSNGQYAIPTPGASGSYTGSTPSSYRENQFNTNVDHYINANNSISAKVFTAKAPQTLTLPSFIGSGPNLPGWGSSQYNNNLVAALQWTQVLTPTLVHQLRAGYSFIRVDAYPQEPINDSSLGLTRSNAADFPGLPQISVVGGFAVGTSPTADVRATSPSMTLIDQWSWTRGKHLVRAGGEIRRSENNYVFNVYTRGTISFLSFNDFLLGNTFVDILGNGDGNRSLRATDYNMFVQDDWKVTRSLTLNLGMRYELDMPTTDTRGRISTFDPGLYKPPTLVAGGVPFGPPAGGFVQAANAIPQYQLPSIPLGPNNSLLTSNDPNNFAPRIGFAYSPFTSGRTAIRGGYGIYYSRTSFQYVTLGVPAPPAFALGISVARPFSNPFLTLPPTNSFPTVVPGVNLSGSFFDRNIRTPYVQQWNLSVQHSLARSLVWETGYVGSRGVNLFRLVNINQAPLASVSNPVVNEVTREVITTNTPANAQTRAPFQGVAVSGFSQNQSSAQSTYHSLQTSLTQRLSRGLQFLVSYTYSKSLDNASGQGGGAGSGGVLNPGQVGETVSILGNQFNDRGNRGVSDFDRTHRFVASGIWRIPSTGRSRLGRMLLKDWQVGVVLTSQSGLPIDVVDSGAGTFYHGATAGLSRASWAPGATKETATTNVPNGYFFNPAAFARKIVLAGQAIPSGQGAMAGATGSDLGDVGRNVLRGPRQNNTDFSVMRRIRLSKRFSVELRSEFFNLWNQVNLANPVADLNAVAGTGGSLSGGGAILNAGNFGRIISTSTNPRLIQFGGKLLF